MESRKKNQSSRKKIDRESIPKYTIGVVSQLLGLPPQVLRRYEESGLLSPERQSGKNRLYSDQDLIILEQIIELSQQGINNAGIRQILYMKTQIHILQQEVKDVREAHENFQAEVERRDAHQE